MRSHSGELEQRVKPSNSLSDSPPMAKNPVFFANTCFMQIKACHVEHEVTDSEVIASDKPSMVFDM